MESNKFHVINLASRLAYVRKILARNTINKTRFRRKYNTKELYQNKIKQRNNERQNFGRKLGKTVCNFYDTGEKLERQQFCRDPYLFKLSTQNNSRREERNQFDCLHLFIHNKYRNACQSVEKSSRRPHDDLIFERDKFKPRTATNKSKREICFPNKKTTFRKKRHNCPEISTPTKQFTSFVTPKYLNSQRRESLKHTSIHYFGSPKNILTEYPSLYRQIHPIEETICSQENRALRIKPIKMEIANSRNIGCRKHLVIRHHIVKSLAVNLSTTEEEKAQTRKLEELPLTNPQPFQIIIRKHK